MSHDMQPPAPSPSVLFAEAAVPQTVSPAKTLVELRKARSVLVARMKDLARRTREVSEACRMTQAENVALLLEARSELLQVITEAAEARRPAHNR